MLGGFGSFAAGLSRGFETGANLARTRAALDALEEERRQRAEQAAALSQFGGALGELLDPNAQLSPERLSQFGRLAATSGALPTYVSAVQGRYNAEATNRMGQALQQALQGNPWLASMGINVAGLPAPFLGGEGGSELLKAIFKGGVETRLNQQEHQSRMQQLAFAQDAAFKRALMEQEGRLANTRLKAALDQANQLIERGFDPQVLAIIDSATEAAIENGAVTPEARERLRKDPTILRAIYGSLLFDGTDPFAAARLTLDAGNLLLSDPGRLPESTQFIYLLVERPDGQRVPAVGYRVGGQLRFAPFGGDVQNQILRMLMLMQQRDLAREKAAQQAAEQAAAGGGQRVPGAASNRPSWGVNLNEPKGASFGGGVFP